MKPVWTREQSSLAEAQGWNVFDCDGWEEIQRLDCPEDEWGNIIGPFFESDEAAREFVKREAEKGCPLASAALEYLEYYGYVS